MDRLKFAIDEPNQPLNLQYVPYFAHAMEKYRWPTTMALQGKKPLFRPPAVRLFSSISSILFLT